MTEVHDHSEITTAEELINALGGATVLGKATGLRPSAVSNWKTRGIPPGWHHWLATRAEQRGLSVAPSLFQHPRTGGTGGA